MAEWISTKFEIKDKSSNVDFVLSGQQN